MTSSTASSSFRTVALLGRFLLVLASFCLSAQSAVPAAGESRDLAADVARLRQTGSVLYIAAHPDDENTQLIAYLARGGGYRTGYLSLTRGDGGQNVLGPDLGEKLGVARTQELLAARRIDGGTQFFSRAVDFGFSKDYQETLRIWDRQQVLSDVVRVIREFQPDVLVTRFSPEPGGTHGHHTASAVLALEAFRLAGDPKGFPEQLRTLAPWQPKRILWNAWPGRSDASTALKVDVSGTDPVRGISFADLATQSRSQHKTQGFDKFVPRSVSGPRIELFHLLAGEPAGHDLLDGVDTSWKRFPGGETVAVLAGEAAETFDPSHPDHSVPVLLKLRRALGALPAAAVVVEKRAEIDRLLARCLGLRLTTTVPRAEVVAGEAFPVHHEVEITSSVPVRWISVRYPREGGEVRIGAELKPGVPLSRDVEKSFPADTPVSQPYWLREEPLGGLFQVEDPQWIGRPENPPELPVNYVFQVEGETLSLPDEPVLQGTTHDSPGVRHLVVIAPVSLRFGSEVELLAPGASREVPVDVTAARAASGSVRLGVPPGWTVSPAEQRFTLATPGETRRCTFSVTAPAQPAVGRLTAEADVAGRVYRSERQEVTYPHLPFQLLQPPARAKLVALEIEHRGRRVGYVPGAGDSLARNLRQIGYDVTELGGGDLTPDGLKAFDAVVFGVRALNVRGDLRDRMPALFAYVESGGTVVLQYNNPNGLQVDAVAPGELHLSSDRVTDETAVMTFLAPAHPALTTPNAITPDDFQGWVQERGLYFPDHWSDAFTPLLACSDPGESPKQGALLVAAHGRGYFVYTGLSFFRQLPAGVPGAYRLFANLVSLGK